MSRVALIAALVLSFGAVGMASYAADEPHVSANLAKTLKAANDALQAKNWTEVLNKTREASAMTPRSSYDDYVIHSMQMAAYGATANYPATAEAIESIIDSTYLPAASKPQLLRTLMSIYYQQKDYAKAVTYGERARAAGDTNPDTPLTIAQAYFLDGKYKEAETEMQAIVAREEAAGHKPSEKALNLIWSCAIKTKDDAAAAKAINKLILNYPKPDYWQNAMAGFLSSNTKNNDDRLRLMTYRLMFQVGILKRASDYTEMAQIALDQGNPGEAQTVLEQAFQKNLYTDPHDKERSQRLLDKVRRTAADDRATMPKQERDAGAARTGDALVQVGGAYLGYGQPDKAISTITSGISKGSLKSPDEAYMLLGIAYDRSKNKDEAVRAFNRATSDPKYAELAKLWALEARG
jgi:Tfp pilus assembly protein PilF